MDHAARPAGSPLSSSPLASTPFSYADLESRLRGEYRGNSSAFLVPAEPLELERGASLSLLGSSLRLSLDE